MLNKNFYTMAIIVFSILPDAVVAWDYEEHAYIGYKAYKTACKNVLANSLIDTKDLCDERIEKEALCYGRLSALSGDHFESPEEILSEIDKRSFYINSYDPDGTDQLIGKIRLDCSDLSEIHDGESISAIESPYDKALKKHFKMGEYSNEQENFSCFLELFKRGTKYETCKKYFNLAKKNGSHFMPAAEHNWASIYARSINESAKCNNDVSCFNRSLVYNAFSSHFLQDSFAVGHIGIDRPKYPGNAALQYHDERGENGAILSIDGTMSLSFGDGVYNRKILSANEAENHESDSCRNYNKCLISKTEFYLNTEDTLDEYSYEELNSKIALIKPGEFDDKYISCNKSALIYVCLDGANTNCNNIDLSIEKHVLKANATAIESLLLSYLTGTENYYSLNNNFPDEYYGSNFYLYPVRSNDVDCNSMRHTLVSFKKSPIATDEYEEYTYNSIGLKYGYVWNSDINELFYTVTVGSAIFNGFDLSALEIKTLLCEHNNAGELIDSSQCHLNVPGFVWGFPVTSYPDLYPDVTVELLVGLDIKTYGAHVYAPLLGVRLVVTTPLFSPVIEFGIKKNRSNLSKDTGSEWNPFVTFALISW